MKPGQSSTTAVLVCMGRAAAHGTTPVQRYSDPTALALLPPESRARVERFRAGRPEGLRERLFHAYLARQSKLMVARTVAIDDAIREAPTRQLVILGAGLDGRAWRMPELAEADVFEVDHPDSQRVKRERVEGLTRCARSVRWVPVDFTRDRLDEALAAAGHDAARPTTWIWEGVVMYITPEEVETTLGFIAARSARGSRIAILYHAPAAILRVVGWVVRRLGEPLRSTYRPEQMRALLERHGLRVSRDASIAELGAELGPEIGRPTRAIHHVRLAIAGCA